MSLILEALKKSEQQRRLGEAPTLASPIVATRRRRSLLPLFGLLIAIALAAGWWLSRSPQAPEATVADAPATPAVAPAAGPATPPVQPPVKPARVKTAAAPTAPAKAAHDARADARTQMPPQPTAPGAAPPNARATVPSKPASGVGAATPPTTAPAVAKAAPKPDAGVPPVPTTPAKAPARAATPAPPAATATPPRPARAVPAPPPIPSIWELPYATRKDVPELTLTMHVWSSDPAQRFVVVHGDRHVEGDDLGDGLTLREIRPDDVVLEFKGQRFTYPRSGR